MSIQNKFLLSLPTFFLVGYLTGTLLFSTLSTVLGIAILTLLIILWVLVYTIIRLNLTASHYRVDIFNNIVTSKKIVVVQK